MEAQPVHRQNRKTPDDYRKERKIKNVVLVIVIAMISVGALLNLLAWSGIGRPYTIDAGIWIGSVGVGLGWLAGKILNLSH